MTQHFSSQIFSQNILAWFDKNGRKNLPWQKNINSYRVWISEIMLQQTQVNTVIPYFERFMSRFPNIQSLGFATLDEVLHLWTGLGYYARARNLHKAAKIIIKNHKGIFPNDFQSVVELPGIGPSTAGAILAISKKQRHPILDGNVKRVLARHFLIEGWTGEKEIEKRLWKLSDSLTPDSRVDHYTQAIMDLGATVCLRSKPKCTLCPIQSSCLAFKHQSTEKFPYARPEKIKPTQIKTMLLLVTDSTSAHRILLEKRPPTGIWGGLYSFPEWDEFESKPQHSVDQFCKQHYQVTVQSKKPLPSFQHVFTHFNLIIHPLLCEVISEPGVKRHLASKNKAKRLWQPLGEIPTIGLPAPIKQLLENIQLMKKVHNIKKTKKIMTKEIKSQKIKKVRKLKKELSEQQ